ncbi:MAG: NfeD family protein [Betaproteobacteria bacterium]|nr:NfeD family protein [Betaproteobacteria bacterium]
MATYLVWAFAGFLLIIIELMTGTFYLLVIGVAALVGALVAWLGAGMWIQVLAAIAVAAAGTALVHYWWRKRPAMPNSNADLDAGQTVVLDAWVNQAAGLARVKYRGSTWDAKVLGTAAPDTVLYIHQRNGGVLEVSSQQP